MDTTTFGILGFILMAAFVGLITLGGVTLAYLKEASGTSSADERPDAGAGTVTDAEASPSRGPRAGAGRR